MNKQITNYKLSEAKKELAHIKGLLTVSNKLNQALLKEREKLKNEKEQLKAELKLFKTSNQTTIDQLKAENKELKKQLESTKGLVTVGNRQFIEAMKKNEELTSKCSQLEEFARKIRNIILKFAKGDILTFPDLSLEKNCIAIQNQCLDPMRQIIQKLDEMQDENCHFDKIKEITGEM